MHQYSQQRGQQNSQSKIAFLFIGSAQCFENDYERQSLMDQGVSFQLAQKGADELQLLREDREVLRNHAKNLKSKCEVVSFDSIVSKQNLLKKKQVLAFLQEKLQKYQTYSEINIHYDGPSVKYTGEWIFKDNKIVKQEELLQLVINSSFRNSLIVVSNSNFSIELLEQYNRARFDTLICYFNSFLFISTSLREQHYHSFYQYYNFQCRNCCFVKQLENSHSADIKKINQLESIDLSTLGLQANHLLNIPQNQLSMQQYCTHRYSFNDVSTQMNTARNQSNIQITDGTDNNNRIEEKADDHLSRQNKKNGSFSQPQNQNNQNERYSIEIKSQDISCEYLSTNHTFNNNNNHSIKFLQNDQIKYFYSSTQPIQRSQIIDQLVLQ